MTDQQPRWVISGGMGSGKSSVRRLLEASGFHTIDSDSIGHEVLAQGGPAYGSVLSRWPTVVTEAGDIERSELGRIVFNDPAELAELERITHPYIFGIIKDRVQGIPDPVAVEIPLLDHPLGFGWRRVIVDCSDEVRLERIVARGMHESEAISRLQSQPTRSEWLARANIVVPNHGDIDSLRSTVAGLSVLV